MHGWTLVLVIAMAFFAGVVAGWCVACLCWAASCGDACRTAAMQDGEKGERR